jgi:hypothetical protein
LDSIGNIRLIGYCKCCVDGLEAMRRLSGDAVEPAVTIIARAVIDDKTNAEGTVTTLLMSDGSATIRFSPDRIVVGPVDLIASAIIKHAVEIERVVISDAAPTRTRELVERLLGAR